MDASGIGLGGSCDIRVIRRDDFPETFKNMKYPPKRLYLRGRFPAPVEQKYLCVIGSRKWTRYGQECASRLINGLKGYPISIVSGLAEGIDGIAHEAALEAGLHCVAFPGSSLDWDQIFPQCHTGLAKRIVASGGALLSQWAPGYPTGKWAFPARNRLMAGLSHAILIIEAGKRSGSLMTAKYAENFNRDVYAVPGSINAPLSYGTHMLIRRGAALITDPIDLLQELGFKVDADHSSGGPQYLPESVRADHLAMRMISLISLEDVCTGLLVSKLKASIQDINASLSLLEINGLIQIEGDTASLIR